MTQAEPSTPAELIRPEILSIAAYQVPDASGMVKLDAMENPYLLPEPLRAELGRRLAGVRINRYPVPDYTALKSAIREAFGVPEGAAIVLGNGSDELITMITVATARPGATVLAPAPGFVMYEMSARFAGSAFVGVPLREDFTLDREAMLAAIARHHPAVIWLAYPNNPTGNCFDDADIAAIIAAAPGLVVVDEAYQPFAQASWMPRLPGNPNLLVMRTVSKLGLAGLRLGYLAGAPAWLDEFEKLRPPYNVNVLTETAALFALEHVGVLDEQAARLRASREWLAAELRITPGVQLWPSQANFVLVRVSDGPAAMQRMRERGVLVKDVGRMHVLLRNCLRLTVGTEDENRLLVAALRAAL